LDGDMRQIATLQPRRRQRGVELGVRLHLPDGAHQLSDATDDDLREEL
jgi:hypothetical protein